jgi:purine nucleoside permease
MHIFTNERKSRAAGITKRHLVSQCPRLIGSFESNNSWSSFILRGIASRNRKLTTIGGVAFARFAVRVAIHLECDKRDSIVMEGRIRSHGYPRVAPSPPYVHSSEFYKLVDNLQISARFGREAILEDSQRLPHH